ncbi:hypothetical protein TWF281_001346 [Arthrobotrys megalospora]
MSIQTPLPKGIPAKYTPGSNEITDEQISDFRLTYTSYQANMDYIRKICTESEQQHPIIHPFNHANFQPAITATFYKLADALCPLVSYGAGKSLHRLVYDLLPKGWGVFLISASKEKKFELLGMVHAEVDRVMWETMRWVEEQEGGEGWELEGFLREKPQAFNNRCTLSGRPPASQPSRFDFG